MIALEAGRGDPLAFLPHAGVVLGNGPMEAIQMHVLVLSFPGEGRCLWLRLLIRTAGGALLPLHRWL